MTLLLDAAATEAAGHAIGKRLRVGDVIALSGPLAAGKTCLARGILLALGYAGDVPSPTFGIVVPYGPPDVRLPVWHVDLYRLDDGEDVDELGLDDARTDGALVIEWPERLGARLWPDALQIELTVDGEARRLTAIVPSSWEARWPFQ
jgi:tRNA threonylcarbamoyladenosine biosynthesis protein TsaE